MQLFAKNLDAGDSVYRLQQVAKAIAESVVVVVLVDVAWGSVLTVVLKVFLKHDVQCYGCVKQV
jgi:hypothetical protein